MELNLSSPAEMGGAFAPYSQVAVVKGAAKTIYIAGQVATAADGSIVGAGTTDADFDAQAEQAFANIEIGLKSAGADWSNVAQFVSYLVSVNDIERFKVWRENKFKTLFPKGKFPTNTLLIVGRLVHPALRVEVQATAVK
jgi:2-iminobutanoate/2-iminopropanoate deaminase